MKLPFSLTKIVQHFSSREKWSVFNILNFIYHSYRRNNWVLDISRFWNNFEEIEIDRPVFLLGVHGGGLSLVSRTIRRNRGFVSVTGNYNYWAGADEMAVILGSILPQELTGIRHKVSEKSNLKVPTNWLYAADEYLPYFRREAQDVTPKIKRKFRKLIRWQIARHALNKKARFTDKSQIYTVSLSFINEILKNADPKFVLVTRNPYAVCYRSAKGDSLSFQRNNIEGHEKKLRISSQHWNNSMRCALEDSQKVNNFKVIKFENVLKSPKEVIKNLCNFIEVEFDEDLLPQPEHKYPFGTKGREKWYPLRLDVNERYFEKMTKEDVKIIDEVVDTIARKLGYSKPQL